MTQELRKVLRAQFTEQLQQTDTCETTLRSLLLMPAQATAQNSDTSGSDAQVTGAKRANMGHAAHDTISHRACIASESFLTQPARHLKNRHTR